ncbi:MAG: hypothetical protein F6K54_15540 [Okeania sp. SIO3B5]|uniref:hypothetical protein n=1 Tax=Okeania sp. SIO3B5 TaxID=2607811 RepID=UPI0014002B03|nr:hypothetical protein [Okeania sp. SIO3B5]NEO54370.1 hypothetical protein [Okeania sp. SIO3B5]
MKRIVKSLMMVVMAFTILVSFSMPAEAACGRVVYRPTNLTLQDEGTCAHTCAVTTDGQSSIPCNELIRPGEDLCIDIGNDFATRPYSMELIYSGDSEATKALPVMSYPKAYQPDQGELVCDPGPDFPVAPGDLPGVFVDDNITFVVEGIENVAQIKVHMNENGAAMTLPTTTITFGY